MGRDVSDLDEICFSFTIGVKYVGLLDRVRS